MNDVYNSAYTFNIILFGILLSYLSIGCVRMTYDDITPPKTVDEAEQNLIKCLTLLLEMGLEEEFNYVNWEDGPKKRFDSAKKKVITRLEGWTKKGPTIQFPLVPTENTLVESSPFEFDTEVNENLLTMEEYYDRHN